MAGYHYRVVPSFGDKDAAIPAPEECQHEWERTDSTALDAYCKRCKHYATLSVDTRDKPPEWWRTRRERFSSGVRELTE